MRAEYTQLNSEQFMALGLAANRMWYVAYTRPRREKKLAAYCQHEGIAVTLPCVKSIKQYGRKRCEFEKPLFPGYVFFQGDNQHRQKVYQNEHTANVLDVIDQNTFAHQLCDILAALDSGCIVGTLVNFCIGQQVRILKGSLAGMMGVVSKISERTEVTLRLDFIGQGAAVVVNGVDLEVVD